MSFRSISSTADCLESVFEPLMATPHLITGHVLHQHESVLVSARSLLVLPLVSVQECRWCVHNYLGLPCCALHSQCCTAFNGAGVPVC